MKRYTLTMIGLLTVSFIYAQQETPFEQRVESQRVAFITERVNLSVEEAQSFWPIYNAYRQKEKELSAEKKPNQRLITMSDAEAKQQIDKMLQIDEQLLAERRDFVTDISNILTPRKILLLWQSERAFKERLVQMLRKRKASGR